MRSKVRFVEPLKEYLMAVFTFVYQMGTPISFFMNKIIQLIFLEFLM